MTALLAADALDKTQALAEDDVSPKMLRSVPVTSHFPWLHYSELIEPLESRGRGDLVRAIERLLLKYRIKEGIRKIDNKLCGGKLLRISRRLRQKR